MVAFEQLIDVEQLREIAQRGTGRGLRVAILDTGIDTEHPAIKEAIYSSHEVVQQGRQMICKKTEGGDMVGHGTACAGIIHSIAPEAELHSVRVMGSGAGGTFDQLVYGLKWAIEEKMDVINLSLGTVKKRQISGLQELVDKAYFQGQFLIAAASNQRQVSYPSHFASLIGVDNQSFEDPLSFHYQIGKPIELVANGIYVKAPSPGGQYRWYTGTSFACPHITGLVARLKSEIPDLNPFQVKSFLWCLRNNNSEENITEESVAG